MSSASLIVFFGAIVGFSLVVSLFLQLALGYSPIRASLTMAAWAVGAFLGSGFSTGAIQRLGRRILHLIVLTAASFVLAFLLPRRARTHGTPAPEVDPELALAAA